LVVKGSGDWKEDVYLYIDEIDYITCDSGLEERMDMEEFHSVCRFAFLHRKAHTITATFHTDNGDETATFHTNNDDVTTVSLQIATNAAPHAMKILSKLLEVLPDLVNLGLKKVKLTSSASDVNNLPQLFVSPGSLKKLVGTSTTFTLELFNLLAEDQAALAQGCLAKLEFENCSFAEGGFILLSGGERTDGSYPLDLTFLGKFPSFEHLRMAIESKFVSALHCAMDGTTYDLSAADLLSIIDLVLAAQRQGHKIKWGDFDGSPATVHFKSCFTCTARSQTMGTGPENVRQSILEALSLGRRGEEEANAYETSETEEEPALAEDLTDSAIAPVDFRPALNKMGEPCKRCKKLGRFCKWHGE
jgi:hypothetical protein